MYTDDFFSHEPASVQAYREAVAVTVDALVSALPSRPFVGGGPTDVAAQIDSDICPPDGKSLSDVLQNLQAIAAHSVAVWHPHTAAHLHFPVLIPALAAEVALTALNPSMDSFDQAPAATIIEQLTLKWLCRLAGLPATADGTFTTGGTQSNYMGLLLARDHFLASQWNWSALRKGLPPKSNRLRILCSEIAHFSVEKSAIQLGLGMDSVVKVAVDDRFCMRPHDLAEMIAQLRRDGFAPFAVVATAGTTDFGSVDPIGAIAAIAAEAGLWLHVDAAYGGAFLLSERLRPKLNGIERAASVTIDFHKAFFQPISCGAFLLSDAAHFDLIRLHADYLNPESYEQSGIPNLVTRSLLTTRRFDALKVWICFQTIGQRKFAGMVERLAELAEFVAEEISADPTFELLHRPEFACVVFRYSPTASLTDANAINEAIPLRLFTDGAAVIGHTLVGGRHCLKLTLNNPSAEPADLMELLQMIRQCGLALERESKGVVGRLGAVSLNRAER
jgi:L-2,4-diaminobutyrate decarboxylase